MKNGLFPRHNRFFALSPASAASRAGALAFAAALLLLLGGCGGGGGSGDQLSGAVRIDGSSTVFPLTSAVAEEFMDEHPRVRVSMSKSGTGGGFAKFLRGETDINDASRTITAGERSKAEKQGIEYIELPVAYDGLAVVAHPKNDWAQCLTTEELEEIWKPGSNVENWNQIRASFPDQPLTLYGAGTASGTFDYFTEVVVGEAGASRTDYNASEDDNVLVQGVQGDPGALGFFGLAHYEDNAQNLKLLGVDDNPPKGARAKGAQGGSRGGARSADTASAGGGTRTGCVQPSAETVRTGTYQPLSRPLFIYVNKAKSDDAATEAFVEFYLKHIGDLAAEVGYVPLSEQEYQLALQRFQNRTTGSMFEEDGAREEISLQEHLRQDLPADSAAAADTSVTASVVGAW
ncbi:MAG: protein sphX [Bacteroidetes bacterium QH_8_67_23]|nr:MAG: protein sphX [Bacteroidetes bacterium QH_8_67_23]